MEKRKDRILLGCILIVVGLYNILKLFGVTIPALAEWWWLIFLVIGLYIIFAKKRYISGVFITAVGLIIAERSIFNSAYSFPIILILLGLLLLFAPKNNDSGSSQ